MDGENNGKPWRIRGYVPQFSDIFGNTRFGNITIEKHILKQRWPQNGPGENRHQKRTQSFYLKMENDKFRTSVNMFFLQTWKTCQAWFDMKCDINDIHMQWWEFLIPTPSFWDVFWWNIFVFMKTIKAKPPKQDCLGPPVEIVGLGWCAAYPGRQRFENGVSRSSTVNLTDTYVFKEIRPLP